MSGKRYTDEFKIEAVKQVPEHERPVVQVAKRLGITSHSLYAWKRAFVKPDVVRPTPPPPALSSGPILSPELL